MCHVSTGDIIRREICEGTALGRAVEGAISRGELAPDGVVIEIIDGYVGSGDCGAGVIWDGFPRTLVQAEAFDDILAGRGMVVDVMFELVVPEDELVSRILLRGRSSGRADDVDEGVIRNRIEVYNAQTAVVADYYRLRGRYVAIDGTGSIDETFEALSRHLSAATAASN